jgi:hypothetical protein
MMSQIRQGQGGELTEYALLDIERAICEDERTAELTVHLTQRGGRVFVSGDVAGEERRRRVLEVIHERCGDVPVVDELTVVEDTLGQAPEHREEIS